MDKNRQNTEGPPFNTRPLFLYLISIYFCKQKPTSMHHQFPSLHTHFRSQRHKIQPIGGLKIR
jgi:hypothetical protein